MEGKSQLPGLIPPAPSSRAGCVWVQRPGTPGCCGGRSALGAEAGLVWGCQSSLVGAMGLRLLVLPRTALTPGAGGDKPDMQKYHPSAEE